MLCIEGVAEWDKKPCTQGSVPAGNFAKDHHQHPLPAVELQLPDGTVREVSLEADQLTWNEALSHEDNQKKGFQPPLVSCIPTSPPA